MRKRRPRHSRNSPPAGEGWVWYTHEMVASPAWRAMPLNARRVLDRVCVELMSHGGTQNGELAISYDEFLLAGLPSRNAIAEGVRVAEALGFLDVPVRGRRSVGGLRFASIYGLTWLDRADGTSRSNGWKRIASKQDADRIAAKAVRPTKRIRPIVVAAEIAARA